MIYDKKGLEIIFSEAINSVDPYQATVKRLIKLDKEIHSLPGKLNIIGFGKASARMAQAIEDNLSEHICSSVIITKYRHSIPLKKTEVIEAEMDTCYNKISKIGIDFISVFRSLENNYG